MVFGTVTDFAIEAEIEPDLFPPSAVWGRMCIWCRGTALGDISRTYCALCHAATAFKWLQSHLEEVWDEGLTGLDDPAVFALLDTALFRDDDRTDEQIHSDAERYGKFDFLTNWGEQFDGFKVFLICPPKDAVRIVYRLPNDAFGSGAVTREGFLTAAIEFVRWFREQSKRLRG